MHLLMCWAYCNDHVKVAARHVIALLTTLLRDESVSFYSLIPGKLARMLICERPSLPIKSNTKVGKLS